MDTLNALNQFAQGVNAENFIMNYLVKNYFLNGWFWAATLGIILIIGTFRIYVIDNPNVPIKLNSYWYSIIMVVLIIVMVWLATPVKFSFTKLYFLNFVATLGATFVLYGLFFAKFIKKLSENINSSKTK